MADGKALAAAIKKAAEQRIEAITEKEEREEIVEM